jgi:prephenate dehydratase
MSQSKPRISFQGEPGAFSEEAALKLLGSDIELVPRPTFEELYTSINEKLSDFILAPIENTLAGSVHRSYDLLLKSTLQIIGEVIIPIRHNLIGVQGSSFEQITVVESHPVALAQCEKFFHDHPHIKRIATEDTAGSVFNITKAGDPTRAAIAGKRAADIYGGLILKQNLQDHKENYTRFLLLSDKPDKNPNADKLSLLAKLSHRPGALYHALEPLARREINLLKIESRPVMGSPWHYYFYLDLQSRNDSQLQAALSEFREQVDEVRVLGHYVSAKGIDEKGQGETA